jgi:carbamoyl-phosphate synthase large subunit
MTVVLVTGAGGSAGANLVDALRRSRSGYRIVGTDCSLVHLHLSTADVRLVSLRADDPGYAESLIRVVLDHGVDVVLPQPDSEVLAVGALRDRLPARTFLPSPSALELAADKELLALALRDKGVAVPETRGWTSPDEMREAVADLLGRHERVWIRARRGAGSRASLPIRQVSQAAAWIDWWVTERGLRTDEFMAAEFLPGREFAYQSVWQDGELVAGQARERVEYLYGHLTPSGQTSTPAVARTVAEPEVDETACAAVLAADPSPSGAYCVDLKQDAAGRPRATEINAGRFFTTSNFFAAAGLNMPDLLVRCALGERPNRVGSSPLAPDLYWIRMVDMHYALVEGHALDPWPRAHPRL